MQVVRSHTLHKHPIEPEDLEVVEGVLPAHLVRETEGAANTCIVSNYLRLTNGHALGYGGRAQRPEELPVGTSSSLYKSECICDNCSEKVWN